MEKTLVSIGLVAFLLASGAKADDISILWQVTGKNIGTGYLPKLASDGLQNLATIDETGTGLSTIQSELGSYAIGSVAWSGSSSYLYDPPQTSPQIAHAPSIALALEAKYPNYDNAIEVHQGGQDSEGALWLQLGTNSAPSFDKIDWSVADWYDTGYNATVAADLNNSSNHSTTVVEVHQAGPDISSLWYHVGTLTLGASPSLSASWGSAIEINGGVNQGFAPVVSIANDVAVLVAQGTDGALWYSIGVVDITADTIDWSQPIPHSTIGYNPTVSVYGDGVDFAGPRVVVEAHQVDRGTGQLTYRTGLMKKAPGGSAPTSITWTPDSDTPYSTGCYPSVALAFYGETRSYLSLTEIHEAACATATTVYSSFGYLSK